MVRVTFSAGVAGFAQDGGDEAELLATADERLFQAKRTGRDRVVAALLPAADPIPA